MTRRGIILLSTLFGCFALAFGVMGVRTLSVGPDPAHLSSAELTQRLTSARAAERRVDAVRADVPPPLPKVPARVAPASASSADVSVSRAAGDDGMRGASYVDGDERDAEEREDSGEHAEYGDDEGSGEYEEYGEYGEYEKGDHDDD